MKILLMVFMVGGASFKEKITPLPKGVELFNQKETYEIEGGFEARPYLFHPSRRILKIDENVKTSGDFIQAISFVRKYGEIIYDFKENKIRVPDFAFSSYSEITFWKEIYPDIKDVRKKIKELSRKGKKDMDIQREITELKENFHQKFLEKRIQVMDRIGNEELKAEAQEALGKLKYIERREK